jgi:DNA-binding IclR family transcriptional regulator
MCTAGAEFITIAEAAGYLETTATRILMMLKKHELLGNQDSDGAWKIDKTSLQLCGKPKPSDFIKSGCRGGCGGCGN